MANGGNSLAAAAQTGQTGGHRALGERIRERMNAFGPIDACLKP